MDPGQSFLAAVDAACKRLSSSGCPQQTIAGEGRTFEGWVVDNTFKEGRGHDFVWWESETTLLTPDGRFARYHRRVETENYNNRSESYEKCWQLPIGAFVGDKGGPFSEWKLKIERLGW